MYTCLIDYIREYSGISISSTEIELLKRAFAPKKLRRKQHFLRAGEVSKYTAFITKGAMRQYRIDDKGHDHIVHLYLENHWAADRESLFSLQPSVYDIEAWEDTEMLIITPKDIYALAEKIPALAQTLRVMDGRHAVALHRRLTSMTWGTAAMRYQEFVQKYPDFVQRFPQHHIASYLGITKETLSKIKRQSLR